MYCKLNSTGGILVINISLLLSLDYHFHMYSMHDPNRWVKTRQRHKTHNQLPHPISHSEMNIYKTYYTKRYICWKQNIKNLKSLSPPKGNLRVLGPSRGAVRTHFLQMLTNAPNRMCVASLLLMGKVLDRILRRGLQLLTFVQIVAAVPLIAFEWVRFPRFWKQWCLFTSPSPIFLTPFHLVLGLSGVVAGHANEALDGGGERRPAATVVFVARKVYATRALRSGVRFAHWPPQSGKPFRLRYAPRAATLADV